MQKAIIEMERKFLSPEKVKFSSDFDDGYVLSNGNELTQSGTAIFSRANGIHNYLYKGAPAKVTYGKGANFSLEIDKYTTLEIIHISSKWLKSKYEIHTNNRKVAELVFTSSFFPYSEKYELITTKESCTISLLLFGLFSWYNYESVCCL